MLAACGWSRDTLSMQSSSNCYNSPPLNTMSCAWCSRTIGLRNFDCSVVQDYHGMQQQQQQQQQRFTSPSLPSFPHLHSLPLCDPSAPSQTASAKRVSSPSLQSPASSSSLAAAASVRTPPQLSTSFPSTPPLPLFTSPAKMSPVSTSPIGSWINVPPHRPRRH